MLHIKKTTKIVFFQETDNEDFSGLVIQVNTSINYTIANYFYQIPQNHNKKSKVSLNLLVLNITLTKLCLK